MRMGGQHIHYNLVTVHIQIKVCKKSVMCFKLFNHFRNKCGKIDDVH